MVGLQHEDPVMAPLAVLSAVEAEAERSGRGLVAEIAGALVLGQDLGGALDEAAGAELLERGLRIEDECCGWESRRPRSS
jgi:hypothetical protein